MTCTSCDKPHTECECYTSDLPKEAVDYFAEVKQSKSVGMKFDTGKLLYSLIPPETTKALAEVLTYGANKYAPNNWQLVENGEQRYLDALFRHLEAYRSGETHDPESGLHHLSHCLTNVAFLHYLSLHKGASNGICNSPSNPN